MGFFSATVFVLILQGTVQSERFFERYNGPPIETIYARGAQEPVWKTIVQKLDHFDPINYATWKMRYIENDQFYSLGGPILIFVGGEWKINGGSLKTGQIYRMAKELNGIMYYTEHRYYGESIPTTDLSTENLKYLSADQALADLAYFIKERKNELSENSDNTTNKVVVFGGSYSANLATWARLKYPHLVQAAWASSGPLRAVADFYEYMEVVNENLALQNKRCVDVINEGIAETEKLLETSEGIETISKAYNTCTTIEVNKFQHRAMFFQNIAGFFSGKVQYAGKNTLNDTCSKLLEKEGKSYEKLASLVTKGYTSCQLNYDDEIKDMKNPVQPSGSSGRQWTYQTCTEYGYFQTSSSTNQPFGKNFPLDFYKQLCTDVYGDKFHGNLLKNAVTRTNLLFGSIKPEVTKVVTVHGTVDPWHRLGILEDLNEDAPTFLVKGTSHCEDLRSSNEEDLEQMREARNKANKIISKWIE